MKCLLPIFFLLVGPTAAQSTPDPPFSLAATTSASTTIDLTWTDDSSNESGFRIEVSPDNVAFALLDTVATNETSYLATALAPATKFYFRILAFNGGGDSDYSETAATTTLTPFADWQATHFSALQLADVSVSGPDADPDEDTFDNKTEFVYFGDPLVEDRPSLISEVGIEEDAGDGLDHLTVTTVGNKLAADMAVEAEASADLVDWQSGSGAVIGPILIGEDTVSVTQKFRAAAVAGPSSSGFLRLTIENKGVPDSWLKGPDLPVVLAEVGGAVIGNRLFLVGGRGNENDPDPDTLAYNLETGAWDPLGTWADRPFQGNHHAVEVFDGKLYVFGGFGVNSEGKLQIFDPVLNSWTTGTSVPCPIGSANSGVIGNFIYLAGGERRSGNSRSESTKTYRYNPANDSWATMADLPVGRHHSAGGTDGSKLYVFGGRKNVTEGYDEVQIYDPINNTWESSSDVGSALAPLPTPRSGMGKAVFYKGEFYTFGGEDTFDLANTTPDQVYPDVEIYHPVNNSWRVGTPMPTARHGSFPILYRERIYLPGGGPVIGGLPGLGESDIMEIYIPGT